MKKQAITYCVVCGARFENGKGWIDEHKPYCANEMHGWKWTVDAWPMVVTLKPAATPPEPP